MSWKKHLKYPSNVKVSDEVKDLMNGLMNDVDKRLGYNGAEEIKRHPWFKDVDWNNLKSMKPPFTPRVSSDCDVKYFETFQEKVNQPFHHIDGKKKNVDKDICFLDFSFDKRSRKTKLLDFFEQIEEELHTKRARDKSSGLRPSNLFNIHTNFQSNLSEASNQSSGNLKEKNIVDIIRTNTLMKSAMTDRQNTSTLTIEAASLSERIMNSPNSNSNTKKTQTNIPDLREVGKETPKTKILPMLETKTKFSLKNSTSLTKSKMEHLESGKRLTKNTAVSPSLNSGKAVTDSIQAKTIVANKDSGVKVSKIKQIEIDKVKLNPGNACKALNLSPRESLLATAIGFKSTISNINNLKSVSPPKSTKAVTSRIQK